MSAPHITINKQFMPVWALAAATLTVLNLTGVTVVSWWIVVAVLFAQLLIALALFGIAAAGVLIGGGITLTVWGLIAGFKKLFRRSRPTRPPARRF